MSEIVCPVCSSKAFKKNGFTRHGKQNYRCLDCGRQFSKSGETTTGPEAGKQEQVKEAVGVGGEKIN